MPDEENQGKTLEIRQPIHVSALEDDGSNEDANRRGIYNAELPPLVINQLQQEARERCKIVELRIPAHAADLARSNVPSTSGTRAIVVAGRVSPPRASSHRPARLRC